MLGLLDRTSCVVLLLWIACLGQQQRTWAWKHGVEVTTFNRTVSPELFFELEELARIVDISYCVGNTGIRKPFDCLSRCNDFHGFELVQTWDTGISNTNCAGYIALSHPPWPKRIIVAFRGTYSLENALVDILTAPQKYVPYPAGEPGSKPCTNCTVHLGFMEAWKSAREAIIPVLEKAIDVHMDYELTLVGHSLGGAVAALAALDFKARGWNPRVTTFGEPKVGNAGLVKYIDDAFPVDSLESNTMFRRVTHRMDPVPLVPLKEWGWRMHAGEIYINKTDLSPNVNDLRHCEGDEDKECSAIAEPVDKTVAHLATLVEIEKRQQQTIHGEGDLMPIPPRFRLWELLFAHRDYFWRIGLCVPGGDPHDWFRSYPEPGEEDG